MSGLWEFNTTRFAVERRNGALRWPSTLTYAVEGSTEKVEG